MARRARASRSREPKMIGGLPSPYIRRTLPFFDPLDEEQITALEQQANWIIEDVGIAFRDDPEALALWKKQNVKIDGDIVRAPADWIRSLCAKAPCEFTQLARNPERSVTIGGNNQGSDQANIHAAVAASWGFCHLRAVRCSGFQASPRYVARAYDPE